jgi:hypothetical protein
VGGDCQSGKVVWSGDLTASQVSSAFYLDNSCDILSLQVSWISGSGESRFELRAAPSSSTDLGEVQLALSVSTPTGDRQTIDGLTGGLASYVRGAGGAYTVQVWHVVVYELCCTS